MFQLRVEHPLSNIEILSWLMSQKDIRPLLGGVYSCDTLPQRHHYKPTLYVANTAPAAHPTGTHWVALLVGVALPQYYDSLGEPPSTDFIKFLGPLYVYSTKRVQGEILPACGYHSLFFAKCTASGISLKGILRYALSTDDETIMRTVQQIYPIGA